jgi:hypothetical protein
MKIQMSELQKQFFDQCEPKLNKHEKREAEIAAAQQQAYNQALLRLSQSGNILQDFECTGVNDKEQIHPKMKSYNHSSERMRCPGSAKSPKGQVSNDWRPVERDGRIEMEVRSDLSIDDLLDRT